MLLQSFATTQSIESHLRLLIMKDIESGPPNAGHIARLVGQSPREYRRHLRQT